MLHDDQGRDCSNKAASQGTLKIVGKLPETREKQGMILLQVSEGTWPCWNLDFRLLAWRTGRP